MTVDVAVSRLIPAPIDVVAAYAGDPTNAPTWYANIRSVRWRTEPPLGLGSQLDFVARFLGREFAYTYEVTELIPGSRLVMATTQGPFPMRTTYTWESRDSGTLMTLRNDGDPHGFAALAAPVMQRAMRRAMTADLEHLEAVLTAL